MLLYWTVLPLAVVLDFMLGDPRWLPHPVRWMGKAIEKLEPVFRKFKFSLIVNGALFWFVLVLSTYLAAFFATAVAGAIHPYFKTLLQIILIYYCLSCRCLAQEALKVLRALQTGDLSKARAAVAMIVGRQTSELDASGVSRATVETVAENLVDGFMAPLFFAALGGAPLAMAYKMVNTLDSMVGYKNTQYEKFGKISARMDDLFNFIPARFAVPVVALCSELILKQSAKRVITIGLRDGRNHTSPNAGFSEAAFAASIKICLGGPNIYHGKVVEKPYIGEEFGPVAPYHIKQAIHLMLLSAICWSLCMWPISIWLH